MQGLWGLHRGGHPVGRTKVGVGTACRGAERKKLIGHFSRNQNVSLQPRTQQRGAGGACAEQILLPSDPRGFSVWLEGSEVTWIGTVGNTQRQVRLCIRQETEA